MTSYKNNRTLNQHDCDLPAEEDVVNYYIHSGWFINLRRRIKNYFLLSEDNKRSDRIPNSALVFRKEKIRQLKHHCTMIHPFCKFRQHWEISFTIILIFFLYFEPLNFSEEIIYHVYTSTIFDVFCLIELILNFNTGFQEKFTDKVIMARKAVVRNYLVTWFSCDLLAFLHLGACLAESAAILFFFQLLRVPKLLKYLSYFHDHFQHSIYTLKIYRTTFVISMSYCWGYCFLLKMSVRETKRIYYLDAAKLLCGAAASSKIGEISTMIAEIILLVTSYALQLILICEIIQIFQKCRSPITKHFQVSQQVEQFMRFKNLPDDLKQRIKSHLDFRFHQHYSNEYEILRLLSPQLRQDIVVHGYIHLLEKVDLFSDLPIPVLCKVVQYMKSELYLPSDVIFTAGNRGESMYFVVSGTLAVYSMNGLEIAHLSEGDNIGEISLLVDSESRTSSLIAIDFCEVLVLQRKDLLKHLERYPEILLRIRRIAAEKAKKLKMTNIVSKDMKFMNSINFKFM